jgi:hypothetical protein
MFLIDDQQRLLRFDEQPYDSEAVLQHLLAAYPDLLAGEQMDPVAPRRWLLIRREAGIAAVDGGADRWSVDHLFLDQDGVPTLVEVKQSRDTRIRREVVGQMLDYAANAVVYLPADVIRSRFEARCEQEGVEPEAALQAAFGDVDLETFWARVKSNLDGGRVRLVFVADAIPSELQRIVEYLNGQMSPTEVYAVEVKQFVGERDGRALRTMTPRLIGRTAEAGRAKGSGGSASGGHWDWDRFSAALLAAEGSASVQRARAIHDWALDRGLRVWWGRGMTSGGFVPVRDLADGTFQSLFEVWTDGKFEVYFQHLGAKGPFVDEALRVELRERLIAIRGIDIPSDALARRPWFRLRSLEDDDGLRAVLAVFEWVDKIIQEAALT